MDTPRVIEGDLQVRDLRFVVLASRFNEFVVEALVRGALDTLGVENRKQSRSRYGAKKS